MTRDLELALCGNGRIAVLVDERAHVVWGCFPRFDGDPVFCALLDTASAEEVRGLFAVDLVGCTGREQHYVTNTAVLVTRMRDADGGEVEVTDCVPRFVQHARTFQPVAIVRRVQRVRGSPRIVIRLRPVFSYGGVRPVVTVGSSHIRYVGPEFALRLTTDASLTAILEEHAFLVDDTLTLLFGPDETVAESIAEVGRRFVDETVAWWRDWVRRLAIPFEWQSAVIRAAISLQQNAFDDTGAIVAALTTSIPESPGSGRNWDYRYCWLRDGYFVVDALNRLGATATMERYLTYFANIASRAGGEALQPVYAISGHAVLTERTVDTLAGYNGMGPVRIGNAAFQQVQHDVYGAAILAATHMFFDERLVQRGDVSLFERLEALGRRALQVYDQPDAGLWELRGRLRVHAFSSVMCWAGCDRLALIAGRLGLADRAARWRDAAATVRRFVEERCFSAARNAFVASASGETLDASMLLLADLGFVTGRDPRFAGTVAAIESELKRGDYIFRYVEDDDFGAPENAFVVCTFWYVNALAATGRSDAARALFEKLLALRNRHGLLAEHVDPASGRAWGNFVQTYSMVGLISSAIRLSKPWSEAF